MSSRLELLSDIPSATPPSAGDRVAIEVEGRTLTYAELHARAGKAAGLLLAAGAKPGDPHRLARPQQRGLLRDLLRRGGRRVCLAPINSRLAIPEIAFILQDSGADLFFVTPDYFEAAFAVAAQVDRPIRLIGVGGEAEGFESYADLRRGGDAGARPPAAVRRRPATLHLRHHRPAKGVRLNNANYAAFMELRLRSRASTTARTTPC